MFVRLSEWLGRVFQAWIRYRYGGGVYALRPPLGYCDYFWARMKYGKHKQIAYIVKYKFKKWLWQFECLLFKKFGGPMREAWEKWYYAA